MLAQSKYLLLFLSIVCLVSSTCNDSATLLVNDAFFTDWKVKSINELELCCNSKDKTAHFKSEIKYLFYVRKIQFDKLISEVDISNEDKFLITESIQSKAVVGGSWMNLETKTKLYQAHLLNDKISVSILEKQSNKIEMPEKSECCSQELEAYERYSGFIGFEFHTVFTRNSNKYTKRVYIEN